LCARQYEHAYFVPRHLKMLIANRALDFLLFRANRLLVSANLFRNELTGSSKERLLAEVREGQPYFGVHSLAKRCASAI
jgi:hypothetical protein